MQDKRSIGEAIEAAADHMKPVTFPLEHAGRKAQVLLHPTGMTVVDVTKFTDANLEKPLRKRGTMTAGDLASFIALTQGHKQEHSIVLMNGDTGAATAILNFHGGEKDQQDHGDLKVSYAPKFSAAWQAWNAIVMQGYVPTKAFAKFIDEHIDDIGPAPVKGAKDGPSKRLLDLAALHRTEFTTPEELLLLSRGLKVNINATVEEVQNTANGEVSQQFQIQHVDVTGKKPLKVPGLFMLRIQVFDRGAAYDLPVRLRYLVEEGKVSWSITIINLHKALEDAIEEVRTKIAEETGLPTWYGSAST